MQKCQRPAFCSVLVPGHWPGSWQASWPGSALGTRTDRSCPGGRSGAAGRQTQIARAQPAPSPPTETVIIQGQRPEDYRVGVPLASTRLTATAHRHAANHRRVIPEQLLRDRAITNINDALRTVPGISLGAGEFSFQGNTPTIRGFVARNDIFLDGIRDFGNYSRDPFNLQSDRSPEGARIDPVRPRLHGRRDQPGEQAAAVG